MSGSVVIRKSNGKYVTEPSNTTIIESNGGVYISYDIDASKQDFRFVDGAEVVGTYYGDLELIGDPSEGGSWLEEIREQFS